MISELNEKLDRILQVIESFAITEMAQRQGSDGNFEYYTLDNEYKSHVPHVHVCVNKGDKHWEGKPLRSGNPLKSIASVILYPDDREYTKGNIEFEDIVDSWFLNKVPGDTLDIVDSRITNEKYKKIIAKWLNAKRRGEANSIKCIDDYLLSNSDFYEREKYQKYIDSLE